VGPNVRGFAAGFAALGMLVAPAVASAAKGQPSGSQPDLVVSEITVGGLANGPRVVVDPSGLASPLTIRVTVTNEGHAKAGPSTVHVDVFELKSREDKYARVGELKRGQAETVSVNMTDWRPDPGFGNDLATADFKHKVNDSDRSNNTMNGPRIAIEPRQWAVNEFSTQKSNSLVTGTTSAQPGLVFRFQKYDVSTEQFSYEAFGSLMDVESEHGTCSYNGSNTVTESPWTGTSYLDIAGDQKSYDAFIEGSAAATYTTPVSCIGISAGTATLKLQDLVTYDGSKTAPKMPSPFAKELTGTFSDTQGQAAYVWSWRFTADVP
jgi:CARDB protein